MTKLLLNNNRHCLRCLFGELHRGITYFFHPIVILMCFFSLWLNACVRSTRCQAVFGCAADVYGLWPLLFVLNVNFDKPVKFHSGLTAFFPSAFDKFTTTFFFFFTQKLRTNSIFLIFSKISI